MNADPILTVRDLTRIYGQGCPSCQGAGAMPADTNICPACHTVVAVKNVSFDLEPGEVLGIMGESGSGKSTLVKMLYFDEQPTSGAAIMQAGGQQYDLFGLNAAQQRWLRNHLLGMVYQHPQLGLNFHWSVSGNIAERLLMSETRDYAKIRKRVETLLQRIGVPISRMDAQPRTFSGGMQQRVQIARALATDPPLLFLDEVTSGLDLTVQARILDLILELQQDLRIAMVVVTHDLGVARLLAGRTIVMRYGQIVESGLTDQILEDPQHPYTQTLVSSAI